MSWLRVGFSNQNLAACAGALYAAFTMQSERLLELQRANSLIVRKNPSLRSLHGEIENKTANFLAKVRVTGQPPSTDKGCPSSSSGWNLRRYGIVKPTSRKANSQTDLRQNLATRKAPNLNKVRVVSKPTLSKTHPVEFGYAIKTDVFTIWTKQLRLIGKSDSFQEWGLAPSRGCLQGDSRLLECEARHWHRTLACRAGHIRVARHIDATWPHRPPPPHWHFASCSVRQYPETSLP